MPNLNAMPLCCVKDYTCSDAFLCTWCTWQHRGSILRRGERGIIAGIVDHVTLGLKSKLINQISRQMRFDWCIKIYISSRVHQTHFLHE